MSNPTADNLQLLIEAWSDAARTIRVKGITSSGAVIDKKVTTNSDPSNKKTDTVTFPPDTLSVVAFLTATGVERGRCYAAISVVEKGSAKDDSIDYLTTGYIYDNRPLKWHWLAGGIIEDSLAGQGYEKTVVSSNPPAVATGDSGGHLIETTENGVRWKLKSLILTIDTSATTANRKLILLIDDGTNIIYRGINLANLTASLAASVQYTSEVERSSTLLDGTAAYVPMRETIMLAGYRFRTTGSLKMGDNIAVPIYQVTQYLEAT